MSARMPVEEESSGAHCVGLKQTILFPALTLGASSNFCDCLMAGGTGRKDHSEVGSSYIHFNFTPDADKTTPSLMGMFPAVMLRERPIFLGGRGGMVGPLGVGYGSHRGRRHFAKRCHRGEQAGHRQVLYRVCHQLHPNSILRPLTPDRKQYSLPFRPPGP
jgi:hypothetical protein